MNDLSDTELINLVKKKDNDALGEIFQRYSPLVMGLCLKYMKDVQTAEDIMMELFEKLPQKISKAEIQNFKSWLYSVSRNECLMSLRKKKVEIGDIEKAEIFIENADENELKAALEREENIIQLEKALLELKKEQKKCIELFYLKKQSYEQITIATGFELKKVKSHIQNGKRNLKLILKGKK